MAWTLAAPCRFEQEIRKSRFVATASPVSDSAEALAYVQAQSGDDARHHCWAYRIGQEYRSADADEPAGTAGRPILAAIDGQGLDRVVVVVARWFGGIKLGAGGLIRAYGGSAAECLRLAERVEIIEYSRLRLRIDFDALGTLHAGLQQFDARKCAERFDADGAELDIEIAADQSEHFWRHLLDATRGAIQRIE